MMAAAEPAINLAGGRNHDCRLGDLVGLAWLAGRPAMVDHVIPAPVGNGKARIWRVASSVANPCSRLVPLA